MYSQFQYRLSTKSRRGSKQILKNRRKLKLAQSQLPKTTSKTPRRHFVVVWVAQTKLLLLRRQRAQESTRATMVQDLWEAGKKMQRQGLHPTRRPASPSSSCQNPWPTFLETSTSHHPLKFPRNRRPSKNLGCWVKTISRKSHKRSWTMKSRPRRSKHRTSLAKLPSMKRIFKITL